MTRIALLGEHNPTSETHLATQEAILHSSKYLEAEIVAEWISSNEVSQSILEDYQGLWVMPGAPHHNLENSLSAIRYAREKQLPTFGTCGGFQLIVLEIARNLLGITDAQHTEYSSEAKIKIITPLSCSLKGLELPIKIVEDSLVGRLYKRSQVNERYYCRFGINPEYRHQLLAAPIAVVGKDNEEQIRVIELPGYRFYIATLFVPQVMSSFESPHPLVTGFLEACMLGHDARIK